MNTIEFPKCDKDNPKRFRNKRGQIDVPQIINDAWEVINTSAPETFNGSFWVTSDGRLLHSSVVTGLIRGCKERLENLFLYEYTEGVFYLLSLGERQIWLSSSKEDVPEKALL